MVTTLFGKNYLSVLGYACVKPEFRNDLLAHGAAAVEMHHLPVELAPNDLVHLNEIKNAAQTDPLLSESWESAGGIIEAACRNPPCPYYGEM